MNETVFEIVLNDILDELKQANISLKELKTAVGGLEERVVKFERQLTEQQVVTPPADMEPVKQVVAGGLEVLRGELAAAVREVAAIVEVQPKNVVKQWRLSFFPDHDWAGNYQYLIKKLTFTALVGMLLLSLFVLGERWMDRYLALQEARERAAATIAAPGTDGQGPRGPAADTLNKKHMQRKAGGLVYPHH